MSLNICYYYKFEINWYYFGGVISIIVEVGMLKIEILYNVDLLIWLNYFV